MKIKNLIINDLSIIDYQLYIYICITNNILKK